MKTYFITRFSIYDPDSKQFNIIKNNGKFKESYKEKLFNYKRLRFKCDIFESVTFPSIVNQTNQNFFWAIYTSDVLPSQYKERLENLVRDYDHIQIFYVKSMKDFYQFRDLRRLDYKNDHHCTVRLDDDDALCKNFVEMLNTKYSNYFDTHLISFPNGIKFNFENNQIKLGYKMRQKNIGLGFTGINCNVYGLGDHDKIHKKYEILYDDTPDVYLCCCNTTFCDSKRKL